MKLLFYSVLRPFQFHFYLLIFRSVDSFCSAKGSKQSQKPGKYWQMCTVNTHTHRQCVYTHTQHSQKRIRVVEKTRGASRTRQGYTDYSHAHTHTHSHACTYWLLFPIPL